MPAPASKLLFGILTKIDRSNEITLVKEKKEQIAKMIGIKASTVNKLNYAQLESMGIKVIVVWGCEIKQMMKDESIIEKIIGTII